MVLQGNVTKASWRNSLHRWESTISHGSRRPQTKTAGAHQWEKPVVSLRQKSIKPQRKEAGGRKSEQPPNHHQPQPLTVSSALGFAHQESGSAATNKPARTEHQPLQKPSSVSNQHIRQRQRLTASAKPLVFHPKFLISRWKTGFVSNAGKLPRFLFCTNSAASLFVRYCQSDRKKKGIELLPKWDYQLLLD